MVCLNRIAILKGTMETFGGGERVAANLCNDLCNDFEVSLITYNSSKSAYYLKDNVKVVRLSSSEKCTKINAHLSVFRLRKYIVECMIDVILIIGRSSFPLIPILAAMGTKTKIVFCDQSTLECFKFVPAGMMTTIYRYITQCAINLFSERIVTLTIKERENYLSKYLLNINKLVTIYNYIDISKFKKAPIKSKKIISVARLDYSKGFEYLIKVAAGVLSKHPDWRWDVYGEGDKAYTQKLEKIKSEYGLDGKLFFMGNSDDIYNKYPLYSIFVFTSRYEGFGLTLLEAMASGLPSVSFNIYSGPSEIICDGLNGYLVDPYDVISMENKICTLINDAKIRESFSKNTQKEMCKFDRKMIVEKWKRLIFDII